MPPVALSSVAFSSSIASLFVHLLHQSVGMGADKKIIEQAAVEMPSQRPVRLRMTNLRLHGFGVFSNVYTGTLLLKEGNKAIAIKKTWPDCKREKNFEVTFLSGENRKPHKNIISMLYSFTNTTRDKRICESFVFDFIPETLYAVVRNTELDMVDIKIYTWQMFSGLHYLSTMDVVHRDLKPVNILVDPTAGLLKISDFGSAKIITEGMKSTPYQVTRYYRPPELVLGAKQYDWTVDVWSGGCCFGEMLNKRTLFPGRDTKNQLKLIIAALGFPSASDLKAMRCNTRLEGNQRQIGTGVGKLVLRATNEAKQLLAKILVYKPKERFCSLDLLRDPFFDEIFVPDAARHNGQPIASCVDRRDLEEIETDEGARSKERLSKELIDAKPSTTKVVVVPSATFSDEHVNQPLGPPRKTVVGGSQKKTKKLPAQEPSGGNASLMHSPK